MIDIKCCPVCKSVNITKIKEYEYRYPVKIEDYYRDKRLRVAFDKLMECDRNGIIKYEIYKCNNCSFIYLNPRLTDEEVITKYYWTSDGMGIEQPDINKMSISEKEKAEKVKARFAWVDVIKEKRIFAFAEKYADKNTKTILDFGGSDGRMCLNLRHKYQCEVIDLTVHPMRDKVKRIGNDISSTQGKQYDIILLIHVLEHVNKPLKYLLTLKEHLTSNGIIIISVPLGSLCEWKVLSEPLTHCNFFDEGSLSTLTYKAGYKLLEITSYPFSRYTEPQEFGEIYFIGRK